MYDWPELTSAHDQFWLEIASEMDRQGLASPVSLTSVNDKVAHWLAPELFISQTCGYPFATRLRGKVQLVSTPVYAVEGCGDATYSSAIVVNVDRDMNDLSRCAELSFAYNSKDSLSGYRCMKPLVGDPASVFGSLVESGAHRQSALMVAKGEADCAAIDAVCWHLFQRFEPEAAARLRVIQWGPVFPALPYITSLQTPPYQVSKIRSALEAVAETRSQNFAALRLTGFKTIDAAHYFPLADL